MSDSLKTLLSVVDLLERNARETHLRLVEGGPIDGDTPRGHAEAIAELEGERQAYRTVIGILTALIR